MASVADANVLGHVSAGGTCDLSSMRENVVIDLNCLNDIYIYIYIYTIIQYYYLYIYMDTIIHYIYAKLIKISRLCMF